MSVIPEVFNISRCSLDDGLGVRSVVYFKGCNMRCKWCHNPESHNLHREISYAKQKCIGCGKCAEICPECHKWEKGTHVFDREKCTNCGKCADVCVAKALASVGEEISPEKLLETVMKDKDYFDATGGGVTLSGGECLLFPEYVAEFLKLCKQSGINTLVESEKHREYTGVGNERIKENILKFANDKMTVRIPLVPGVNDDICNLEKTVEFAEKAGAKGVQLLKYNYLYASKYELAGKKASLFAQETQSDEDMKKLCEKLSKNGFVFFR